MKFICLKLLLLFALLLPAGAQQGNFVKISTETYEVIYPTNFWLKNRTNIWVEIEGFITSGSGGSNSFGVNNTFYTPWNYTNSAEIEHTVTGSTNFSSSIVANSISTNKIDSTFRNWVTSMGSSGVGVTVNGLPATNFWDNGYITFLDGSGTGDWSLNIGNDTISTNKINSTFYNWILSLAGGGGGTTNGLGVNGTFRTDWNAINSAEIAYTVSGGTNWYGSLVAGSIGANKLATTGTGTSTNFLAGDYSYKQVTTNMIPGLNAILATIGSGGGSGGGIGTNFILNGVMKQPAIITNGLSVVWSTNANGHVQAAVSLVDSNIPSTIARLDSPVFTGTVTFSTVAVSTLQIPFASRYAAANSSSNLVATSDGASWTNLNGSSIATGTVADARIDAALARLASPTFTGDPKAPTASPGDNDTSIASTAFVTAAVAAGGGGGGTGTVVTANGGANMSRANITTNGFGLLVTQSGTNILLSTTNNYPVDYYAGGFLPLYAGASNALTGDLHYKQSSDIRSPMWESGTEWNAMGMRASGGVWSVAEYNTNDFTVLESFITIDPTDTTGPTDIITFPNSGFNNKVVFEADVELNGNTTFSGAATNTGSFGAPVLYVGTTNVAEALASGGTTVGTNGATTGSLVAYQPDGSLATTNIAIASTNTAFGASAGRGLSSGNFNTFIGYNAATNVTTGNSSVIIGYQAGKDATNSIGFTTILGTAAGPSVMADFNTMLGYHTGNLLRNGGNNVFVGYQAGNNTTNGADNVFVGSQAGTGSGAGSRNTFVGRQAGNANTTANDNVYVGYQSGLLSTTSDGNTFVGVESGETLTAGANNNTFIGYRSGRLITSGYNNTFLGYGSGNTHTVGNNNIFIGINVNGNTNTANHFLAGGSGQPITSVYFGEGIADASPSSFSLRATSGTGTDIAGAGITIAGGQSTGSGAGGSLTFQTSPAGSTGTSTNALVTALLIGSDSKISVTKTITAAGTTSVQTINKVAGSVNLAAAASSVVVTNSLVDANSVVIGTVASNDTTAKSVAIVPESGKFTIYPNAAPTAETRVNWIVFN